MRLVSVFCVLAFLASVASGEVLTFDAADAPAVGGADGGVPTWNAGGYWDVAVTGTWQGCWLSYEFGDMSAMTDLTVDLKGDYSSSGFSMVLVSEDGAGGWLGWYRRITGLGNYGDWTTVTMDLDEANWDNWGGTWAEVIGNVKGMEMYHFGAPSSSFDNLGFVPEPATLGLLAVGLVGLLRRRR